MTLTYKEAGFPAHYRKEQVRQVMDAVYRLRSISITGLAGMGKSNVVRFIVSHPQVRPRYLKERAGDFAFLHLDCAGLTNNDETEIFYELATQLQREGSSGAVSHLPQTSQSVRRALKEQILGANPDLNLVLALDYFDQAAARLDAAFYNYLFHLRNARPKGNLSYIFATRRPLGPLYELQELLDDGCTVGPLGRRDALDSIQRDEARLGCTLNAAQRDALIACTGGHPGFLKNAGELLGSGKVDALSSGDEMARQLLQSEKVRNLCRELWEDLTTEERGVLLNVARGVPLSKSVDGATVAYLKQSGLLVKQDKGRSDLQGAVFCPLFESFVRSQAPASDVVRITAVFPNQARIETAAGEEWVTLSPKLFALLLALVKAQGQVVVADEIITQVYGSEAIGVTNAALSQLVKRLRGELNPRVQRMTNDPVYTCVETIRDVGYRLNG